MPVIEGLKWACMKCIKGHRSSSCEHSDRPLFEVKKRGRPRTQCTVCQDRRRLLGIHERCVCEGSDQAVLPRPRGPNSKAILAIQRAALKNAVRCGCQGKDACHCVAEASAIFPSPTSASGCCSGRKPSKTIITPNDIAASSSCPPYLSSQTVGDLGFFCPPGEVPLASAVPSLTSASSGSFGVAVSTPHETKPQSMNWLDFELGGAMVQLPPQPHLPEIDLAEGTCPFCGPGCTCGPSCACSGVEHLRESLSKEGEGQDIWNALMESSFALSNTADDDVDRWRRGLEGY